MPKRRNPGLPAMLETGATYGELCGLVIEGDAEIIEGDSELAAQVSRWQPPEYPGDSAEEVVAENDYRSTQSNSRSRAGAAASPCL